VNARDKHLSPAADSYVRALLAALAAKRTSGAFRPLAEATGEMRRPRPGQKAAPPNHPRPTGVQLFPDVRPPPASQSRITRRRR
jgi:hypothetical protein